MYEPVRPLFERFSLPDDDPRILYPILLSSALWGILGGAASAMAAFFAQRERKRLAVAAMGLGMFLFIAGTLLIGNVAQKSVIYRTWMWGGTAILVLLVAAVAVPGRPSFARRERPWACPSCFLSCVSARCLRLRQRFPRFTSRMLWVGTIIQRRSLWGRAACRRWCSPPSLPWRRLSGNA